MTATRWLIVDLFYNLIFIINQSFTSFLFRCLILSTYPLPIFFRFSHVKSFKLGLSCLLFICSPTLGCLATYFNLEQMETVIKSSSLIHPYNEMLLFVFGLYFGKKITLDQQFRSFFSFAIFICLFPEEWFSDNNLLWIWFSTPSVFLQLFL